MIASLRHGVFTDLFRSFVPAESMEEQWDMPGLEATLANEWQLDVPLARDAGSRAEPDAMKTCWSACCRPRTRPIDAKIGVVGKEAFAGFERSVMLQSIDSHWREHLAALDHLRQGIHLRGYAQKNPKQEYKREAFELFGQMLDLIRNEVVEHRDDGAHPDAAKKSTRPKSRWRSRTSPTCITSMPTSIRDAAAEELLATGRHRRRARPQPVVNVVPKVGRNDPCPCGSGKKYKQCHGKLA